MTYHTNFLQKQILEEGHCGEMWLFVKWNHFWSILPLKYLKVIFLSLALNPSLVESIANKSPKASSRGFQLILFFEDYSF